MEKNKWIIGLLIVLILLTYYIDVKGHIEGYDGQTSLVTNTNIQQPRGKNADKLYYFLFSILIIIIITILYITITIKNFTTLDDIYDNLNMLDPIISCIKLINQYIYKSIVFMGELINELKKKLGSVLFVLFIFVALYSVVSSIDYINYIITFSCIIILILIFYSDCINNLIFNDSTECNELINEPFIYIHLSMLVILLYITFIPIGMIEGWIVNSRLVGMFGFVLLFYVFNPHYVCLFEAIKHWLEYLFKPLNLLINNKIKHKKIH